MQRRSFLKVAAACWLAPNALFRREVDAAAILRSFTDSEYSVYAIGDPFRLGGLTYATNGRQAIRADISHAEADGENLRRPALDFVFSRFETPTRWIPWQVPAVESLTIGVAGGNVCPVCEGKRRKVLDYFPTDEQCETDPALADYDVDDNSVPDPACEYCRGTYTKRPSVVEVFGQFHTAALLKKLSAIPGLEIARSSDQMPFETQRREILLFRGGGFEGATVPASFDPGELVKGKR